MLEKDVSFGAEGTVMTNVCSALQQAGNAVPVVNFVGGLGGDDISQAQMRGMFEVLFQVAAGRIAPEDCPRVGFLGVDSVADELEPLLEDCATPLPAAPLKACATVRAQPMRKEADSHGFEREDPAR